MLADLKTVEDKLYQPDALDTFMNVTNESIQKHSVHDLIKQLNKATKKETRDRIKYCFSKIGQSHRYKDLLLSCLCQPAGTCFALFRSEEGVWEVCQVRIFGGVLYSASEEA